MSSLESFHDYSSQSKPPAGLALICCTVAGRRDGLTRCVFKLGIFCVAKFCLKRNLRFSLLSRWSAGMFRILDTPFWLNLAPALSHTVQDPECCQSDGRCCRKGCDS